ENFMYDGKEMRVIDWEYGGMNDGFYDLACVCVENPLDAKCEETYLRAYCGGEPTEEARARMLINKFLVTTHWSTWSLVQISYGKDEAFYWEYGRTRAVQACSFLDDPNFDRYLELIEK
ncbi:MAG: phosphotransferase, partial [Oscillospiraceae bacterium]